MKKMKRLFAVLLAMAMVLGMSVTAFAEKQEADNIPRSKDTVDVKITNIKAGATVTLYKIVKANYQNNGIGLVNYEAITGVDLTTLANKPTSGTINTIANNLLSEEKTDGHLTPWETISFDQAKFVEVKDVDKDGKEIITYTYTQNVAAGVYIAIINKSTDGTVYNPILLTAAYAPEENADAGVLAGQLVGGAVSTGDHYMEGATAVAKSTEPKIEKGISGTTDDNTIPDEIDGQKVTNKGTASVGDKIDFTLNPTVPTYPVEAINKTFFIADTMDPGLTFDYSTLKIEIADRTITSALAKDDETVTEYKMDGKVIAKSVKEGNGFKLAFQYTNLLIDKGNGAVHHPTISYSAIVNEKATFGKVPNTNDVVLYYANQSNKGKEYDNPKDNPQGDTDITEKHDKKQVYTYRLAFLKTDDATTNPAPLGGAVFGIYEKVVDAEGNPVFEEDGEGNPVFEEDGKTQKQKLHLVDQVTTNAQGYAETTNVRAGTYVVKELVAPDGYTLNPAPYEIPVNWTTATTEMSGTVTKYEYTSNPAESLDGVQVGWLKNNQFYAMDEFTEEGNGVAKAYVKQEKTTTTTATTVEENKEGAGVSYLKQNIPNTKLTSLPSTGGMGTMIFTVVGCLIMIVAAGFYFSGRKKSAAK